MMVTPADTLQFVLISSNAIAILFAKCTDLIVAFFNENHARLIELDYNLLKVLFFVLRSTSTVVALQITGAFPDHRYGGGTRRDLFICSL